VAHKLPPISGNLYAVEGGDGTPRKRRQRNPSVRTLIKQVEKVGKRVSAVTVEGITLKFEEPATEDTTGNPWDSVYERH
jgi:hypothetical protein